MWRVKLLLLAWSAVVASDDGNLDLYVNRMYIYDLMLLPSMTHKSIEYLFADGDTVDVQCTRSNYICALKLHYEFDEENIGGNGTVSATSTDPQYGFIGLGTTLRVAHDGKTITCSCTDERVHYWIKMTLVNTVFDGVINLKLNGVTLRYRQPFNYLRPVSYLDIYDEEETYRALSAANPREHIDIEWSTSEDNVTLQTYSHIQTLMVDKTINTPSKFKVAVAYNIKYQCLARNTTAATSVRRVTLDFLEDITQRITDDTPLTVNVSRSLLEMYELAGDQLIYYYYEDGEKLTLTCSTSDGVLIKYNYTLVFGNTVETSNADIIKQILLNDSYENKTVGCYLMNNFDTIRNIRILFRMKDAGSKRGDGLPNGKRLSSPMDTHNTKGDTVRPSVTGEDIMNITNGAEVSLKCQVSGKPQPTISWQFMAEDAASFELIPGSESELQIASVHAQHAGRYKCVAHNVLATAEHVTTLIVQGQAGTFWMPAVMGVSCVVCACVAAALCYVLVTRRARSRISTAMSHR